MIRTETNNGIRTIRMDRPEKKNALTGTMYEAMAEALEDADMAEDVRVSLILGGPGAFTAGNDIADFMKVAETGQGLGTEVIRFLKAIAASQKPVLAAVDGLAIGVGATMLMHCDMVFASPRATIRTPFLDLGLVPEAASTLLAPAIMGPQRAFELLCLGAPLDAEAAFRAGLVNHVVEEGALEETALAAARTIAAKPPAALAIARRFLRGDREAIIARIDEESAAFRARLQSDEARAAFAAFMARSKG
ncbi:enoyl-CoA hydratase/carnithine racemase [Breoghania corrubedonensis]|uniref:Enoyl-CoA hydratase/carnithine racemase n=1 Tax=Breoghania corrubedonensis TaxID=665038 RepID=A0A2T5VEI4_9HYPH|nr:crotonase/enoyl-CoA hydratase family protein [Breoghania corrubedonensis]PTW62165.1 enoyl-CoA hydratase/carnithine racemase [Breoghania corrubedonensis]